MMKYSHQWVIIYRYIQIWQKYKKDRILIILEVLLIPSRIFLSVCVGDSLFGINILCSIHRFSGCVVSKIFVRDSLFSYPLLFCSLQLPLWTIVASNCIFAYSATTVAVLVDWGCFSRPSYVVQSITSNNCSDTFPTARVPPISNLVTCARPSSAHAHHSFTSPLLPPAYPSTFLTANPTKAKSVAVVTCDFATLVPDRITTSTSITATTGRSLAPVCCSRSSPPSALGICSLSSTPGVYTQHSKGDGSSIPGEFKILQTFFSNAACTVYNCCGNYCSAGPIGSSPRCFLSSLECSATSPGALTFSVFDMLSQQRSANKYVMYYSADHSTNSLFLFV